MAKVTIQVLEGLERGHVFRDIPTPFTIGREEGNAVQLNDERVSRFHAKVQEDSGQLILTDLESTNGTRVNGHPVKMRILRLGDQISVGRCLLLVGSREQLEQLRHTGPGGLSADAASDGGPGTDEAAIESAFEKGALTGHASPAPVEDVDNLHTTGSGGPTEPTPASELFPNGPPPLPLNLSPLQQAQVSDVLQFIHAHILRVLQHGQERRETDPASDREQRYFAVAPDMWRRLAQLEYDLAVYLETIADPSFRA